MNLREKILYQIDANTKSINEILKSEKKHSEIWNQIKHLATINEKLAKDLD